MQHAHFEVLRSVLFAQKYWKIPTRYFPNLAHTVCNACCLFQLRTGASHAFSKTKRRRRLLGLLLRRAPGDATANTWTGGAWPTGTKRGEGLRRGTAEGASPPGALAEELSEADSVPLNLFMHASSTMAHDSCVLMPIVPLDFQIDLQMYTRED